jgi:hypothetical protein
MDLFIRIGKNHLLPAILENKIRHNHSVNLLFTIFNENIYIASLKSSEMKFSFLKNLKI